MQGSTQANDAESHGKVTYYASTPQEYKDAIDAAEELGLTLADVEAINSSAFKVHDNAPFDGWNARATHRDFTISPGRKWFTVKIEGEEPFKVRDPGYHERTPEFRLKFHS